MREDAAVVLSLIATVSDNARDLLTTGGAKGIAFVATGTGRKLARTRSTRALDTMASPLLGQYAARLQSSPVLRQPLFWVEGMVRFLRPDTRAAYPQLAAVEGDFFFELFHTCAQLVLGVAEVTGEELNEEEAVRQVGEVIESFENETKSRAFLASIFGDITARVAAGIAAPWILLGGA